MLPDESKFGLWGGEILEVGDDVDEVCLAVVLVAVVSLEVLLSELEIEVVLCFILIFIILFGLLKRKCQFL